MGLSLNLEITVGTQYNEAIRDANAICKKLNLDYVIIKDKDFTFTVYKNCNVDFVDDLTQQACCVSQDFHVDGLRVENNK